jgi:hypothetical protein
MLFRNCVEQLVYFSKFRKAYWEENTDMCSQVRNEDPYNNGKILLDMIDAHTFDFLTGNANLNAEYLLATEFITFVNNVSHDCENA